MRAHRRSTTTLLLASLLGHSVLACGPVAGHDRDAGPDGGDGAPAEDGAPGSDGDAPAEDGDVEGGGDLDADGDGDLDADGDGGAPSEAPRLDWARPITSGTGMLLAALGNGVAGGQGGSVVATGTISGPTTFDGGGAADVLLETVGKDPFVARYSAAGDLLWARRDGGPRGDDGYAVAAGQTGEIYVTGSFVEEATFGEAEPGETVLVATAGDPSIPVLTDDMFLARYEASDGALVWAISGGGGGFDYGVDVALAEDGGAIVAGAFQGEATFGAGEPAETTLESAGERDLYLLRVDPAGGLLWAVRAGGAGEDWAMSVAVSPDGSIFVSGQLELEADFGAAGRLESAGRSDLYLARFSGGGAPLWARRIGGAGAESYAVVDASSEGLVTVAGTTFSPEVLLDDGRGGETTLGGVGAILVARYDAESGELLWARRDGGSDYEDVRGLAATAEGGAIVTGAVSPFATFGAGEPGEVQLLDGAGARLYAAGYGPAGAFDWVLQAGGGPSTGWAAACPERGRLLLAGQFASTLVLDGGEPDEVRFESGADRAGLVASFALAAP